MQEAQYIPYNAVKKVGEGPVLILAPHADDEVFGCGGAIAAHIAAGDWVQVVILTNGAAGYGGSEIREQESRAAAELLGVSDLQFWNLPDRGLENCPELAQRIKELMIDSNIQLVYAPAPTEIHPDHRVVAELALTLIRSMRGVKLAFYEVSAPLAPNCLLDISPYFDLKQRAMKCFPSQLETHRYNDYISGLNSFRTMTLPKEVIAAEAFWLISHEELQSANPVKLFYPMDQRLAKELSSADIDEEIAETIEHLQKLISSKQANSSKQQLNLDALEGEIRGYKERLDAITNSKSWRWTKVFRFFFGKRA